MHNIALIEECVVEKWFIDSLFARRLGKLWIMFFDIDDIIFGNLFEIGGESTHVVIQVGELEIIELNKMLIQMLKEKSWQIYCCNLIKECNSQFIC